MGVALAATLSLALPGLGCASTGDSEDAQGPEGGSGSARGARGPGAGLEGMVVDDSRCVSAGKRVAQVDLNQDDFADLITVYNAVDGVERVSCKQVDHNFDGRLDAFYYFDASGNIDREQYDLDFDGRIDVGRYFENDVVTRDEQDLDLDGAVDTWRYYDKGRIVRMETDRDADGRPDMFTYYVRERIDRIGYDVDGDGKADQWDHDAARRARVALDQRKQARKAPPEDEDADTVKEPSSAQESATQADGTPDGQTSDTVPQSSGAQSSDAGGERS